VVQIYATNHYGKASYIAAPPRGQAKLCLVKVADSLRLALAMQRSDALDLFPVGALAICETERLRRLALATGSGP
jgi:hypothetical protein